MRHGIGRLLAMALVLGVSTAACNDDRVTAPGTDRSEDDFELAALATIGIAQDQANASSTVPSSAMWELQLALASSHGSCTFSASTGRVVCPDITRNGMTISRSYAFYDALDKVQQRREPTTVKINTQVWTRGTAALQQGTVTMDRRSDLTATGVQAGSTRRTLNGTERGSSTMDFQTSRGRVTSNVVFGDTTIGLVLPQNDPAQPWPLAGTVIHSHQGTRTLAGQSASNSFSFRSVMVFDGSSKVKITITANGQTRTCVRDLATRTQVCTP